MKHPQDEYRTQTDTLKDHTIHILMGGDHVVDQYRPLGRWMMVRFPEHRFPRDPPNAMTMFTQLYTCVNGLNITECMVIWIDGLRVRGKTA